MRVADIEIEAQSGEARFFHKGAKIGGIAHFAGGVFEADGGAGVACVEGEMFEGAESGVAFARVGGFARAAHVQDHAGEGQIVGGVEDTLEFIHGFDAADAFDLADGEGRGAFAIEAEVAARGACSETSCSGDRPGPGRWCELPAWWRSRSGCGRRRFRRPESLRRRSA